MLKVNTRKLGNVAVVAIQGRIVNGETAPLREAVNAQMRDEQSELSVRTVVLELAQVNAIDASGLGLLLDLRRHLQSKGIRFKLMNASSFVRQVLEVTRLDSVFEAVTGPLAAPAPARSFSAMHLAPCA